MLAREMIVQCCNAHASDIRAQL